MIVNRKVLISENVNWVKIGNNEKFRFFKSFYIVIWIKEIKHCGKLILIIPLTVFYFFNIDKKRTYRLI